MFSRRITVNSDLVFWEHLLFWVMYFLKYEISYFIWSHILRIFLTRCYCELRSQFFWGNFITTSPILTHVVFIWFQNFEDCLPGITVNPYLAFSWQFHGTFPILSDVLSKVWNFDRLIPLFEACLLGVTVSFGLIFWEFMKHFLF